MTKEETIEALHKALDSMDVTFPHRLAIIEAIEHLSHSSLPSNLDEAANNYGVDIRLGYPRVMDETDKYIYNAFKAGAEWMAGQGASYNTEVGWIDGPTVLDWPDNILDGFKMGDEVIVQIRKK